MSHPCATSGVSAGRGQSLPHGTRFLPMRGKAMGGPSGWQHGGRWPLAMSVHHTGACQTGLPLMVAYLGWEGWGGWQYVGCPRTPLSLGELLHTA